MIVTAQAPAQQDTLLPGRRMTLEEFEAFPDELLDENYRYELVEGVVCVSSAPGDLHQLAVLRLARLLDDHASPGWVVLPGAGAVGDRNGLIPDLMLRRRQDVGDRRGFPDLVVEVLSPSTRSRDRTTKRTMYARRGIPSYWLVDVDEPSVVVLERADHGEYVEAAEVVGDGLVVVSRPFDLSFRPADLVAY